MTDIDREKLKSIGFLSAGRTRDQVREGRDHQGHRYKAVTDELGNVVTQRVGDRQDVTINAPHVSVTTRTNEER